LLPAESTPVPIEVDPAAAVVDVAVEVEALRLREALSHEVRGAIPHSREHDAGWIELVRNELALAHETIDRPELLVVVDRNPRVQQLMILLATPQGDWQVVGGSRVSTGQKGRFDHYVTPRGVFHLTDAILGYRAEGTLNENGIRGLGAKGMRVWDFGWQVAMKGWNAGPGKPNDWPPYNSVVRALRPAAKVGAQARNAGIPPVEPKERAGDVLIAAHALDLGLPQSDLVVATMNVGHLAQFVAAELWTNIKP